jgi:prephenate dehydratase
VKQKIGYLGPEGTFSEMAMREYIRSLDLEPVSFTSIPVAVLAVHEDTVTEAVVPVENSLEGAVNTTLDLLAHEVDLMIKHEIVIPVSHCLLGKSEVTLEEIEIVYSHPQAVGQCMRFIRQYLPQATIQFTNSTAEGAQKAAGHPTAAAIGMRRAADLYGLSVLQNNIHDINGNCTRFLVLGKTDHLPTGADKTSLLVSVPDTPGSLYIMLGEFASRGINLQKIESRPSKQILGEYIFFVDVNGHRSDPVMQKAIKAVRNQSFYIKILGSYPCHRG